MLLIVYFLETVTLVVPQTLFSLYISLQPKYGLNNAVVYNYAFFSVVLCKCFVIKLIS